MAPIVDLSRENRPEESKAPSHSTTAIASTSPPSPPADDLP
ncbi:integrase, partial [Mesorhizobium sp. M7A.F.Ca.CA.001.08.2.1]